MILHSRLGASSAVGLLIGASLVVAACGAEDDKKPSRRGDAGAAGEETSAAGQGGSSAGAPAEVGGEGGAALPSGASAREILGLPTELMIPVVCGAARAGLAVTVQNASDQRVTLERVDIEGAFQLETELPLSVEPGASQSLQLRTAPGVVGTDKPGDVRNGSLSVVSSVGNVSIALRGTVQGSTVSVDSIPGAPLTKPIEFTCSSAGQTCPTQSFHIVNTGDSPIKLAAPVGESDVVGAFVPGAPELTLLPGAGVKVELRAAAGASVSSPGTDALTLAVEGSCEVDELRVETSVASSSPCQCYDAPPGIQAGSFAHSYECGDGSTFKIPLFNGTAQTFTVEELLNSDLQSVPDQFPLELPSGQTVWLELLPAMQAYPGYTQQFTVSLASPGGTIDASGTLSASGSWLSLQTEEGGGLPSSLALGCGSTALRVYNGGDVAAQVLPPVLTGAVVSDFTTAQTIEPQESYTFHVSALSNAGNACATAGNIAFPLVQNDCSGETLALATTYAGECTCNGL